MLLYTILRAYNVHITKLQVASLKTITNKGVRDKYIIIFDIQIACRSPSEKLNKRFDVTYVQQT